MPIVHRVATFNKYSDAGPLFYAVLFKVSSDYPPVNGRLHTRYAPVRRSPSTGIATRYAAPRLACVRPAASVYPEPGSNSPLSNPSPDSLLKSTSPLLYTPLPIFFLRYYRSAIGSGYLIFSKNSLAHDRNPSLFILSHPSPSPFAGAKVIPFSFSIQIFFKVFLKVFFQPFAFRELQNGFFSRPLPSRDSRWFVAFFPLILHCKKTRRCDMPKYSCR